jgi:Ca-activated chloride channel family protein
MFRWEVSNGFYLLVLIPMVALLWWWSQREISRLRQKFGSITLLERLTKNKIRNEFKLLLLGLILLFLILAYVNPQAGAKREKQKIEKSDIFIALDISNSMNARDVSPSRLERAKRFVSDFIHTRYGDQFGLIYYAGSAFLQIPLTTDLAAAEMFVKSANTNMSGTQGTNIGAAIQLALRSVQEPHQRALIVISDGEDHDDKALSMAAKAKDAGWNVFTIGVGSDVGAMVPVYENGQESYIYDENGNPVKSVLNQQLLKDIASKGGGSYYQLTDDTKAIISDMNVRLDKLQKHAQEVQSFTEYKSYYQYLLFPAIALMVFGFFYDFKEK